jgi:hypothetical protein
MINKSWLVGLMIIMIVFGCDSQKAQSEADGKNDSGNFVLENTAIRLIISKVGGMFTSFELKENPVNPFGWALKPEQMPENNQPHVFAGHFLCTGRWGEPSKGEMAAGIPHNGEVNTQAWIITEDKSLADGTTVTVMSCTAPIEKLDVLRTIHIPSHGTWFGVKEVFTNNLPVARLTNFVQHGTVNSPFLTAEMVVNTNAGKGFDQRTEVGKLDEESFDWPYAILHSGNKVDLRKPATDEGFVTTHLFPDTEILGWVTAYNPEKRIVLGYVFKVADYRWFNYWNYNVDGKPYVRGLEFGTTGLGKPYSELLSPDALFFDVPSYQYMDAGQSTEKSWICFQLQAPADILNIENIILDGDYLKINAEGADGKQLMLDLKVEKSFLE